MATSASVAIELENGQVMDIHNHGDGYPEHLGAVLVKHYSDPIKVKQLIQLGSASFIDANIGNKINFDDRKTREQNQQCLFYGRDRGESNTNAQKASNFDEWFDDVTGQYSYSYIFDTKTNTWAGYNGKKEIVLPGNPGLTRSNDIVANHSKLH
jgi:hypothetical protein